MLLLRVYENWRCISFLGDHFRVVARGRKLYVIVLVCLGLYFVGMCRRVLVCGRQLLFLVLCRKRDCLSWGYWCPCWGHWTGCVYTAGRRCLPIVPRSRLFPGTLWTDIVTWQTLEKWSGWPRLCVKIPVSLCQRKLCLTSGIWFSCERWLLFLKLYPDRVYWRVTCCSWVWFQSDDNFLPYAHRAEGCGRPPLCHCGVFELVLLCAKCWGDLID